ncbi:MAG: IreB family regulatory phosphoprotein [Clostridiales bacterium]|nr:IreB family regulatory phosphoprotein [Clostridiales bacterium]
MESFNDKRTIMFSVEKEKREKAEEILITVYKSLEEKGYNPVNQIVGYILSGDPSYITSYNNSRNLIRNIERDELLEELLKSFIETKKLKV